MKTITNLILIFAMTVLVAWGCSSLDPLCPGPVDTGSVSFARFHVMGDNYTAGMQNGGLVEGFQGAAWSAVIARAVRAPGHAFPNISENGIPRTMYVSDFSGPVIDTLQTLGQPTNLTYAGFYNNMAIPAATLHQLLVKRPEPATDTNPFFGIVLRDSTLLGGAATAVAQAAAAQPTLLGVWAGWMDVYGSATAGTDLALTPAPAFEADYRTMMDTFVGAADAVVAANIPHILDVPYFATIPPVVVDPDTREPILIGGNPVPLLGPSGPLSLGDKVTLPAARLLAQGIGIPMAIPGGTDTPLPGSVVIDVAELTTIETRIAEFNTIIDTVCSNRNIPLMDASALFARMSDDGFQMRGETYTSAYLESSLFSVDGLHPNSIGYYVIALEFIKVINASFGAAIPQPKLPLGPFRSPSLGASQAAAAAASITPEEWGGLRRLLDSGIAHRRRQ
jgi:hypothetical protein